MSAADGVDGPSAQTAARRRPVQQRSRERYERMLASALDLIAATGSEGLKMSEVADRAGVPIGSLYQFFPDRASIVATLAERMNAESRDCIRAGLAHASDADAFEAAFSQLFDEYRTIFNADPAMRDVWSAMQASPKLRAIQLEESRSNASIVEEALARIYPDAERAELAATALLIMHLGEEAMRLAASVVPAEGERLYERYKAMAMRELAAIRL